MKAPVMPDPRPDDAIFRIARTLARQAAREDHAREQAKKTTGNANEAHCDIRQILNRPPIRPVD
jgi:hypothetical protein